MPLRVDDPSTPGRSLGPPPWRYVQRLLRQWRLVVASTLIAASVALLQAMTTTPVYTATTTLFLTTSTGSSDPSSAYSGGLFAQQRAQSYAALVSQRRVAEAVVEQLRLRESATEVRQRLSAQAEQDSVLLVITATDRVPERAQAMADAAGRALSSLIAELEREPSQGTSIVRAAVVQGAELPTSPTAPAPVRDAALGAALGLVVGAGFATLRTALDRTITSAADLGAVTSAVVCVLPRRRRRTSGGRDDELAAYRHLRTVLAIGEVAGPRVVVVAPVANVPDSTAAARAVASVVAEGRRRVVLVRCHPDSEVDLDSRRGAAGLTTVLSTGGSVGAHVRPADEAERMWLLRYGSLAETGRDSFGPGDMDAVLEELLSDFDVVVLDAPPLEESNALVLSRLADGVLLVVTGGSTTLDDVDKRLVDLAAVNARLLGVVLGWRSMRTNITAHPVRVSDRERVANDRTGPSDVAEPVVRRSEPPPPGGSDVAAPVVRSPEPPPPGGSKTSRRPASSVAKKPRTKTPRT